MSSEHSWIIVLHRRHVLGALAVELEHYARTGDHEGEGMTLRTTQIYRREDGQWRVIHRHGDILAPIEARW